MAKFLNINLLKYDKTKAISAEAGPLWASFLEDGF